jgi:hypothetical protein
MKRPPEVIDLVAVRASLLRLDALAVTHPELQTAESRERLAAAMADMENDGQANDDREAEEGHEEGRHRPGEGEG